MHRTAPALLGTLAAATLLLGTAPAAHAVIDPAKIQLLESIQKVDPVMMATCATGGVASPASAVAVPPEVPLVGCVAV
ncbi:hypothetical protein [Nonomuraea jiangxiensis]|uniref:Small secreted domain n=1 Tax=Nonomuraea jiangxiensis TaxID=633440 RepID=A0A1G9IVB5_9ACTN|nr:hypothetical protein [Nonomuraea jiangxiensis]SDL29137.1 hypothetical protein SAMN05421869_12463 [Nonomuraea jiangxiensis]